MTWLILAYFHPAYAGLWRWAWFFHPRFPFVLHSHVVRWCCYCQGWGCDPRDTDDCPLCYGRGFE